jgi:hypothetical protein
MKTLLLLIILTSLFSCSSTEPVPFYKETTTVCFQNKDQSNEKLHHCSQFNQVDPYKWHSVNDVEEFGDMPDLAN